MGKAKIKITARELVMRGIDELVPYANNAKIHGEEQIAKIRTSLREFGFVTPVLIDEAGNIIAGHGRVMAARAEGMQEVPCVLAEGLTEAQRKAYILADNRMAEMAEWDKAMLKIELEGLDALDFGTEALGFDEEYLSDLFLEGEGEEEPEEIVEDDPPEIDEESEPVAKPGDIWQLGRHRLMCGDSTDKATVEMLMDGKKADMVFTDPPYGVSYTGGLQFKNGTVEKNNRQMIKNDDVDIYEDVFRILSTFSNGACYIWFAGTKAATLYSAAEKYGEIHSLIIWVKNGGYGALNANYKQKHEPCLYWKPNNCKLNFVGATTETTVWEINKDGVNGYHPTQKPVALPAKAISNHDARTVLDLFGGSGSTLIACEQLDRTCYMMELDPKYCDVIVRRWEALTGEKAVLLNG